MSMYIHTKAGTNLLVNVNTEEVKDIASLLWSSPPK